MDKKNNSIYKYHNMILKNLTKEEKISYYTKYSNEFYKYTEINCNEKGTILDSYLKQNKHINYNGTNIINTDGEKCNTCKINFIENLNSTESLCKNCGIIEKIVVSFDKPNYIENSGDKTQFTYDRRYHFKDLINQIQGKETTNLPEHILENIKNEIIKNKIPFNKLQKDHLRKILKKMGYNKYYEHSMNILNKLNPDSIITFSLEIENKLFYMFECIQEPFILFCPENRKNMINYNYIFYKFCEILHLEDIEFKKYFTLLKCGEKLRQLESIWKNIINYNKKKNLNDGIEWEFYSNIFD